MTKHYDDASEAETIPFIGLPKDSVDESLGLMSLEPPEHLKTLCEGNLVEDTAEYRERLNHELEIIHHLRLDEFFLALKDIHDYAIRRGYLAMIEGPAAGSLVVHLLGLCPVDPLRHRLLFEFYLDPEQTFPPRQNVIVSGGHREIVEFARSRYGWEITDENDKPYRAYVQEWESFDGEHTGNATIDVLEHPGLAVIQRTVELIQAEHSSAALPRHLPVNDPQTLALFQEGDTEGIYAFDGEAHRELLRKVKPTGLDELAAVIALGGRFVQAATVAHYLARKSDPNEGYQSCSQSEEVLRKTLGVLLFWEQIAELVHQVAGLDFQDGRKLHMALVKRKTYEIDELQERYLSGAEQRHVAQRIAEAIFDQIKIEGPHTTCKASAISDAIIAYQMGYLKAHFSNEFDITELSELDAAILAKLQSEFPVEFAKRDPR